MTQFHATPDAPQPQEGAVHRAVRAFLRTPLLTKIIVLDLSIDVVAFAVLKATPPEYSDEVALVSMAIVLVLNGLLVAWALRPLAVLESTAQRVAAGEFDARAHMTTLADRNLVRIGGAFNTLLDRVQSERVRVRALASQVVAAEDLERARIARELHDGTAQELSALDMLISSVQAIPLDDALAPRIQLMKDIVADALSDVRALSHAMHPRVLDDLGLVPALDNLARRTTQASGIAVEVDADVDHPLTDVISAVLYRVAQEATHNAVKHAQTETIRLELTTEDDCVVLTVSDDGVGFELVGADDSERGMGLFVMEERVSLVDGDFAIDSVPGRGTVVRARVPLAVAPQ